MDLIANINNIIYRAKSTLSIASIVFFLVLCLIFYFIFLPNLIQVIALSRQIKAKNIEIARARLSPGGRKVPELEDKINMTQRQLKLVRDKLFWEKDISRFLNELTALASDLQIEVVSLKPESSLSLPSSKEKGRQLSSEYLLAQAPISVTFRSNYDELLKFLSRIEKADKFIKIDSLSIQSNRNDIFKHNITMMLNVFSKE